MDKGKIFEKLIWDAYSQLDNYDRLRYKLFRIKEIMSKHNTSFSKLPVKTQFDYCVTIGIIVVQSATKDLRQFSLSKDKNEKFEYSIDEGYVPPVSMDITKQKFLTI